VHATYPARSAGPMRMRSPDCPDWAVDSAGRSKGSCSEYSSLDPRVPFSCVEVIVVINVYSCAHIPSQMRVIFVNGKVRCSGVGRGDPLACVRGSCTGVTR
jgi:hypothetical protein